MKKVKFSASPAALLLYAFVYYILDNETLPALLLPVIAHEAGHLAAIWFLGMRVRGIKLEIKGLCIDYYGKSSAAGHAFLALAGPAAGLMYAAAASVAAEKTGLWWLYLSSGISLALSAFNMLPVLPLDGGRMLESLTYVFCGERKGRIVCETLSVLFAAVILLYGLHVMFEGKGCGLLIASLWALMYQEGVVKRREIL